MGHALATLARGEGDLQTPSPAPQPGEDHGHRLPPRQVVVDLTLDKRGYRDVPVLTLHPVLEHPLFSANVDPASPQPREPSRPSTLDALTPSALVGT